MKEKLTEFEAFKNKALEQFRGVIKTNPNSFLTFNFKTQITYTTVLSVNAFAIS